MGRIEKFRDYFRGPGDVLLFLSVLRWALVLPGMIEENNLENLLAKITPRTSKPGGATRRLVVYVNFWLNMNVLGLKSTCLKRSLLLYRFLNIEGLKVRIHYGVRMKDGKPDGHSWLTFNERPFLQDGIGASNFKETFSYPRVTAGERA